MNTSTAAFTGKVTGKSPLWVTPGSEEEVSAASTTLLVQKAINWELCSTPILLYLSQDFKERASLNVSGNQNKHS